MNMKLLRKCLIMLGLLLFFTVLIPYIPGTQASVQAAETNKEKSEAYRLNFTSIILAKGKSIPLKTYNVGDNAKTTFKSQDQEIASVSDDGLITANKVGETVITVIIKDGTIATSIDCSVTVGPAAISVKFTQSLVILGKDKDNVISLSVILKPSNTVEDAKFSSSDSDIVAVSPGGRVTAKAYGLTRLKAEIDATEESGAKKSDYCTVIVVSTDNVTKLESYFNEHTELDKISNDDLLDALANFFNKSGDLSSPSLITNLDRYLNEKFDLD